MSLGLDSKTITRRNVAQSTAVFSIIVAMLTLAFIGLAAYMDFSDDLEDSASVKSIPQLIEEQKQRSEQIRKNAEMIAQSSELLNAIDKHAEQIESIAESVEQSEQVIRVMTSEFKPLEHQQSARALNSTNNHVFYFPTPQHDSQLDAQMMQQYGYSNRSELSASATADWSINIHAKARSKTHFDADATTARNVWFWQAVANQQAASAALARTGKQDF
jgi:hypothetical protein